MISTPHLYSAGRYLTLDNISHAHQCRMISTLSHTCIVQDDNYLTLDNISHATQCRMLSHTVHCRTIIIWHWIIYPMLLSAGWYLTPFTAGCIVLDDGHCRTYSTERWSVQDNIPCWSVQLRYYPMLVSAARILSHTVQDDIPRWSVQLGHYPMQ
jgi:hypothetical protein